MAAEGWCRMSDLAFYIQQYLPSAEGVELEQRIALLKARDWAAALRGRAENGLALDLACLAHDIAGQWLYAEGESTERLSMAVILCRRLVGAAMVEEALSEGEVAP